MTYSFRPDGSLQKESISQAADTYEAAATAAVETEKEYDYASINMLMGITTKKNGTVTEKVEFTYDSENNRTSKKVTDDQGERMEFYYYDANGDLVSISQKSGIDPVENLMNFYRDANGQLLSFEYKGQIYDYLTTSAETSSRLPTSCRKSSPAIRMMSGGTCFPPMRRHRLEPKSSVLTHSAMSVNLASNMTSTPKLHKNGASSQKIPNFQF